MSVTSRYADDALAAVVHRERYDADSSELRLRGLQVRPQTNRGWWRRMRDSNPRGLLTQPAFQASAIGH